MPLRLIPSIHRATHRIGLHLTKLADPRVTQAEAHILAHLAGYGDSTIAELHRAFAHKRSTLTSILDRLEARRLVTRRTSEQDRRTFVIRLTPEGKRAAKRVYDYMEAVERRLLKRLTPSQLASFTAVLEAVAL